jgi:hypothetical protein
MASNRYQISETKYARFYAEGRGRGVGAAYRPFLQVDDLSSRGRSHRVWCAVTDREHHLFSDGEYYNLFLKWWDPDVTDLREQYPLPRARTLAIATALGVRHPERNGTPVVMTTDLVTTRRGGRQTATAVKVSDDARNDRVRQKLAIEEVHWRSLGVDWEVLTEVDLKTSTARNVVWALKALSPNVPDPGPLGLALAEHVSGSPARRARHACRAFDDAHGLRPGAGASVLRLLVALRRVEVDMSGGPLMDKPTTALAWVGR